MFNKIIQDLQIRKQKYLAKREQLNTTYSSTKLYLGYHIQYVSVGHIKYHYKHFDCFLGDANHFSYTNNTTLTRLTGDNCTHTPIPFTFVDDNPTLIDNNTTYVISPEPHDIFTPPFCLKSTPKPQMLTLKQINNKINNYNYGNKEVASYIAHQNTSTPDVFDTSNYTKRP